MRRASRRHIRRVLIENFQSHARTELLFGPGLNAILGPSDNGKSAILRAIRWALYSEPRGADFVRSGARECRVTVEMSDGVEIVRELLLNKAGTGGRNRYILRRPGEEPQVFEGFGAEVPLEIIKAHGMPPVILDKDKRVMLNLGTQLESPFLLAETGSLRARAVGRLLGVHVVDAADRSTQRDLKELRRQAKALQEQVESYAEKLLPYADLPEEEARLAKVERVMAVVTERLARRERLVELRQRWAQIQVEKQAVQAKLAGLSGVEEAEQRYREAIARQHRWTRLATLALQLRRIRAERTVCVGAPPRLAHVEAAAARLAQLEGQRTRLVRLAGLRERLRAVLRERQDLQVRLQRLAHLAEAELLLERGRTKMERLGRLRSLHQSLVERRQMRARLAREIAVLGDADAAMARLEALRPKIERLRRLQDLLARRREVRERMAKGEALLASVRAELLDLVRAYEQTLQQHPNCPTCGQRIQPGLIPEIVRELME
jgi:exonuclease SbcC